MEEGAGASLEVSKGIKRGKRKAKRSFDNWSPRGGGGGGGKRKLYG